MSAVADELMGEDRTRGIEVFSRRSQAHGGKEWTLDDIEGPAHLRLYRATALEHSLLGADDRRIPVPLRG